MNYEEKIKFREQFKRRLYDWIIQMIKAVESVERNDNTTGVIAKQLLRSGTSIGANYMEAISSGTKKGFAQMIEYSLKSGNESKFWILLLRDLNKGDAKQWNCLLNELMELTKIFGASLCTIRNKGHL